MKAQHTKAILIALLALFFLSNIADAQWQQTNTPPGGSVWALASIGTNLFAGTASGGIYYSPDEGITWVQRNGAFPAMRIYSLVADGSDLYAGGTISIYPAVYKSSDNGLTWTDITSSSMNASTIRALLIIGTDIYAVNDGGSYGIFKSPLSGISTASWTIFNSGLTNLNIRALASNGSNILAGTYGDGVWISPANSANWTSTTGMGSSNDYIAALAVSGTTVFAGSFATNNPVVYRSLDNGLTWAQSSTSIFNNKSTYALITTGNAVYAGTEGEGVFVSNDNGVTWTDFNTGFKDNAGNWYCNQINVRSFAIIGNTLFAGTDCGVWKIDNSPCNTLVINAALTGINPPNNRNTIQIYPNPAKTHIYIDNGNFNLMNGYTVEIVNSIGQQVFTSPINQQQFYIDLSGWTGNGTYIVRIIDAQNNTIVTKKIVLQ